ncbi:MAG TPA: DUF2254 domain-containing protein [Acidimicrobiia bacterium]|nr:DUF2254 domain-containing protein [Acidimicrobiia bacterium]
MRTVFRRVRESLFTIPALIVLACIGAAFGALYLDSTYADSLEDWPLVLGTTVVGGRAVLTTIAGATITVAAIVFSITALSTQMAASQYSPRALGGFFEDSFQQAVIGLIVGTFLYALLVLASASSAIIDGGVEATPSVSVTVALILAVASAIAIVWYINRSLRRMQIDSVVRRIAGASLKAIDRYLDSDGKGEHVDVSNTPTPEGSPSIIRSTTGGWVTQIDAELALAALPPQSLARIDVTVGDAVSKDDRIATIWPDPGEDWDGVSQVRRSIITASERSLELDPTFGMRQLVDIALRALSPGVNDPTTAVDVIFHLKTPVRRILLADAPRRVFAGEEGRRVFLSETPGRTEYVHDAFSEIRLAASGQPHVLTSLIEVLSDLKSDLDNAELSGRRNAVEQELELTVDLARRSEFPEPDLRRVLRYYEP